MNILGVILSFFLAIFAAFHALLFLGLPLGEASWGGKQGKVLPPKFRIASFFASIFFVFSIAIVLSETRAINWVSGDFSNGYVWFLAGFTAIGTIMNTISPSKKERLWAPIAGIMLILSLLIQLA